jgi:lipopolysaccharide export system permease protein
MIVVVVDISEKTDDFVKSGLPASKILTDYYFGFIPRIDAMLFPLFIFISVIFFTSKMAGRSEIISILSSGVSFRRFLMPYFFGGLFFSLMLWMAYQFIVPNANKKWADFEKNYIDVNIGYLPQNSTYKQNIYFRIDPTTYASIRGYDTVSKSGNNISIQRMENNQMVYNLRASNFHWDTTYRLWEFNQVTERKFQDKNEQVLFANSKWMAFSFKPIDLGKDDYLKDQMPTKELKQLIEVEKIRGSEMLNTFLLERYNRDAIPASVLILTIIGAVLASRKVRGGSGLHLALGVVISMLYILLSRFSVVFATKGNFTPMLAAWTPNILFSLLTIYLYKQAPK